MDFALSETQEELRGLAARILEDRSGLQHLKERDRSDDWYDLPTWQEFAKANLLGIALAGVGGRSRLRVPRSLHGVARGRPQRLAAPGDPDARLGRASHRAVRLRRAAGDPRQGRERRRAAHGRARRDRRRAREAEHHRDPRRRRLEDQRYEVERSRRDRGRDRAWCPRPSTARSRCSSCPRTRPASRPRASRR